MNKREILNLFNTKEVGPYNIDNYILLAVCYRGGFFMNPTTKSIVNVVFKNNGYENCIMGDLDYMKRLFYFYPPRDYIFTDDGYNLLDISNLEKEHSNFKAPIISSIDDIIAEDEKRKEMDRAILERVSKSN